MDSKDLIKKLSEECRRVEEDVEHSFKGHYNAADDWSKINLILGLPSAVLGAVAGGISATDGCQAAITAAALLASALVTCLTFLRPGERADSHKSAAHLYQALRNNARIFREIDLESEPDFAHARSRLKSITDKRDELNASMPSIPRRAYEKAKKDIDSGRAKYSVDKERLQ